MKTSLGKTISFLLQSFLAVTAISLFCFFALVVKAKKISEDVWSQLGLTVQDANSNIKWSICQGSLSYYGAKNAKNILTGNSVAVVNEIVAYAKKYSSSAEFKASYKTYREGMKRKPYEFVPRTPAEIKAQEKQNLENNLKIAEANLNSTNPKVKNGAPTAIANIKNELATLDDPNNPKIKRLVDEENRMAASVAKQNEDELKKFELKYPEDPQVLIKKRLEEILSITADVDYAAELQEKQWQGKTWKVFVNPQYERKRKEWKLAFRAGKSTTDAVRAAATKWLAEFNN